MRHVDLGEVGVGEVDASKVLETKRGTGEVCVDEVGTSKRFGSTKKGVLEIGVREPGSSEVCVVD